MFFGVDSSEGKKCCVSRAYAVCWVTPNFWENALTAEKKNVLLHYIVVLETTLTYAGCDDNVIGWLAKS